MILIVESKTVDQNHCKKIGLISESLNQYFIGVVSEFLLVQCEYKKIIIQTHFQQ